MSEISGSDQQLVRRMLAGKEAAFAEIYRRHSISVYRYAMYVTGAAERAQDVTQETFLFLMRSGHAYDGNKGPLLNWLLGIARNVARRNSRIVREAELLPDYPPAGEPFDVLQELTRQETIRTVRDAVQALPLNYREVVALCELQEFDYQQAATVLGCPVGTVRSRLHRARKILLAKLQALTCV